MTYITVHEASQKWKIGTRRICILCRKGRIPGAVKMSGVWMIPLDADKPEDKRKSGNSQTPMAKRGIEPILLMYNPTFFETRQIAPTPEERIICEIQEKYLRGKMTEAYAAVNRAIHSCNDDRYRFMFVFLRYIIDADYGKKDDFLASSEMLRQIAFANDANDLERAITLYYMGYMDHLDKYVIGNELFDTFEPQISLIIAKKTINKSLHGGAVSDVSALEVICHELEKRDCPLISAYYHLYLAVYFNILGEKDIFEFHFTRALQILIPRKWYTPIAEYSATIDLSILAQVDLQSYQIVSKLAECIIDSYIDIGIFEKLVKQPTLRLDTSMRIGYKIVQGKSIEAIAMEMHLSQYKVKKHIEDLYSITGVISKQELKAFILKHITI